MCHVVFFFKQKTAYEMRISDWSSDVCSSDLEPARIGADDVDRRDVGGDAFEQRRVEISRVVDVTRRVRAVAAGARAVAAFRARHRIVQVRGPQIRSEEHTSELQSLMRISYAVFCLKKKNEQPTTLHNDWSQVL